MPPKISDPKVLQLYNAMQNSGARGGELAQVLDRKSTNVKFISWLVGGFTLNLINTIFLQPLSPSYDDATFKYEVTLLAHEACHVQQGFIVDSLEQEARAYLAQAQVADELGLKNDFIERLRAAFANVNLQAADELDEGRRALVALLGNQPATMLYKVLPVFQPTGLRAIGPAIREVTTLIGTTLQKRT